MIVQDELDAYDRHQRELEEKLDEKTAALIHLQVQRERACGLDAHATFVSSPSSACDNGA